MDQKSVKNPPGTRRWKLARRDGLRSQTPNVQREVIGGDEQYMARFPTMNTKRQGCRVLFWNCGAKLSGRELASRD
jgi:hypothetical protein